MKDIDPHLRFMARPQLLDAIIVYLQSAGGPVDRDQLAHELSAQKVDTLERVRRVISHPPFISARVDPDVQEVIAWAIAPNPADRPATALRLAERIEELALAPIPE